jgi:Zn ribbon nucleic-acid-binding protein
MKRKLNPRGVSGNGYRACPHCRSGSDKGTLGLFWEVQERCWRCVICGYRHFGNPVAARSR